MTDEQIQDLFAEIKNNQSDNRLFHSDITSKQEEMKTNLNRSLDKMNEAMSDMRRDLMGNMDAALAKQNAKMDAMHAKFLQMQLDVAALGAKTAAIAAASADDEGDHPMGTGSSTPITQDNKKRKGAPLLSAQRGASLPPPRFAQSNPEARSSSFAIFVGG